MRDQDDKRHDCSAESECQFPRYAEREPAANQVAGESAAQQTSHARGRARHPGERSYRLNIEATRIVKIFWEPEEIKKPGCIAQELGDHKSPGFPDAKKVGPGQRRRRIRNWRWNRASNDLRRRRGRTRVRNPPPYGPEQADPTGENEDA